MIPVGPLPCWGWGDIPDQYGRRWDGDHGSNSMPKPLTGWLTSANPARVGPRRTRQAVSPADGNTIR